MRRLHPLTLDTYIASRLLSPFIQGVAMFWGLLLALDTVRRALDFYEGGGSALASIQFFFYSSPQYLALSLPMGMLFAGIYTFGELSSENEITAMTSAGVPFRRLVVPAMAFAVGASLFSFFVSEMIAPWCNHHVAELEARVAPGGGSHGLSNRIWRDIDEHGRVNMIVFAAEFSADPPTLRDLTVLRYEYGTDGAVKEILLTRAREATYDSHYWWTLRGAWTRQVTAPRPLEWEESRINLYRPPAQIARLDLEARTLTISMLRGDLSELATVMEKTGGEDSEAERKYFSYATELALRFSVPLACLVFAMAGCPMGVRPERSGRSISYGLSFGIIMLYYVFLHYMTRLGYQGVIPGWVAAWTANVVVAAVGAVLIFRVPQ